MVESLATRRYPMSFSFKEVYSSTKISAFWLSTTASVDRSGRVSYWRFSLQIACLDMIWDLAFDFKSVMVTFPLIKKYSFPLCVPMVNNLWRNWGEIISDSIASSRIILPGSLLKWGNSLRKLNFSTSPKLFLPFVIIPWSNLGYKTKVCSWSILSKSMVRSPAWIYKMYPLRPWCNLMSLGLI